MNTWAAPGVQCVCINDDWTEWLVSALPSRGPMLNEVLTISEVTIHADHVYLFFEEIPRVQSHGRFTARDICWWAEYFRPLEKRKTDISIFTAMLTDRRIPVDA